jgi:hypothetical protein
VADKTGTVVSSYLKEDPYTETNATYRTVGLQNILHTHGHWVKLTGSGFVASLDHSLVDKQDFNAPFRYTFATDKRMWYQRTPDLYADQVKGWESISLPFTAELVTTQQKGEITHFSQGSIKGHEYWLREFDGIDTSGDPAVAAFPFPTETDNDPPKTVTNTFLWDYYYESIQGHQQQDMNNDLYQTYYNHDREYNHYPYLQSGTPYIIGFPGELYNDFDLSGTFVPTTTALPAPEKLNKQYITFASEPGTTIEVSDGELGGVEQTHGSNKYTFMPSYLNTQLDAGAGYYVLSEDGSQYEVVTGSPVESFAFRPYFQKTSGGSGARSAIVFSMEPSEMYGEQEDEEESIDAVGSLDIKVKKRKIIVTSTLRHAAPVLIVNMAGQTKGSFTIEPGETVETNVYSGVYIVNKKKVIVR